MKQIKKIPSIQLLNVSKDFDEIHAVRNVSFETYGGDIIALLGPNGAGKSTLMNMIAGYLETSLGKIFVNGNDVSKSDVITKKDIGFLPEGSPLYADMSVKNFLKYFIELKMNLCVSDVLSKKQIQKIYREEFERITEIAKIESVLNQKIEFLSKGYTRRVGFAASLIGDPGILLLDEPTDGLDPNQKTHIRKIIKEMSTNKTIIISTHLLEEAETLATQIILVNKGCVVASGKIKDILSQAKKKTLEEAFKTLTKQGANDE